MIDAKDISVVIQGPVDKDYTPKCINSIKRLLPEAEIIISTWKGSNISSLVYDQVVFSEDPGCGYDGRDNKRSLNVNRWIVSSVAGIRLANRPYVLKCRSDAELENTKFLKYWDKYDKRDMSYSLANHKIIIPSPYTMKYLGSRKKDKIYTPFHVSDWYCFGLKTDIEVFVDIPLVSNIQQFARYFEEKDVFIPANYRWWMDDWFRKMAAEQYIGLCYAQKKFTAIDMDNFLDWINFDEQFAEAFLINNFIVLDPCQFGMIINKFKFFCKHIYILGNELWSGMYRNYAYTKDYCNYFKIYNVRKIDYMQIKRGGYIIGKLILKIKRQLGFNIKKIIDSIKQRIPRDFGGIIFSQFFLHALRGQHVFRNIKKKYPFVNQIYICPYRGTGDSYIVGNYFKKNLNPNNSIFIVQRNVNKKILNSFDIENVEVLSTKDIVNLQIFQKIKQTEQISILHYDAPFEHGSIGYNLAGYKDLNFADFYDYLVFKESVPVLYERIPLPGNGISDDLIERILVKKTILLAPYSDSIPSLKENEWSYLAECLIQKGYKVFTNCANESEKAIKGTTPINVKFEELAYFLDMCGLLISVRSGLCDIACKSNCRKIILYPDYIFYNYGKYINFFTLNIPERNLFAEEYEYNLNNNFVLLDNILSTIDKIC